MEGSTTSTELFAFGPLERAIAGARTRHPRCEPCDRCDNTSSTRGGCIKDAELADVLGVHVRSVGRWRNLGLSASQADQLAIRANLHPSLVWGSAWERPST